MAQTTISVHPDTLERFNDRKADATDEHTPEQNADLFLQSLLDTWDKVDEYGYGDGATTEDELLAAVEERMEALEHDAASGGETVSFDDITRACRKALRDELPEGALRQ